MQVIVGGNDTNDRYHFAASKATAVARIREFAKFAIAHRGYALVTSEIVLLADTLG